MGTPFSDTYLVFVLYIIKYHIDSQFFLLVYLYLLLDLRIGRNGQRNNTISMEHPWIPDILKFRKRGPGFWSIGHVQCPPQRIDASQRPYPLASWNMVSHGEHSLGFQPTVDQVWGTRSSCFKYRYNNLIIELFITYIYIYNCIFVYIYMINNSIYIYIYIERESCQNQYAIGYCS